MIAPANTGRDNRRRIAVNITDQIKRLIFSADKFLVFKFIIVVIKLRAPKIDEIPAK